MGIIGFALICLIVGALLFALGCFLFYWIIIALCKIFKVFDVGCGCFGLIIVGFIVLSIMDSLF